jgi:hypothetical protein
MAIKWTVRLLLATCLLAGLGLLCRAEDTSNGLNDLQGEIVPQIIMFDASGNYDVYMATPTWNIDIAVKGE